MKGTLSIALSLLLAAGAGGIFPQEEKFSLKSLLREREELVFDKTIDVAYGKIYQFRQQYRGLEVYGASYSVATDKSGKVLSTNDGTKVVRSLAPEKLSEGEAESIALSYGGEILGSEKVVYGETPQICYEFESTYQGGTRFLISAVSGKPLLIAPSSSFLTVPRKQKDFYGNEVELPIEYEVDDQGYNHYYLADEVRNIYCYDAQYYDMPIYETSDGVFDDAMAVSVYNTVVKAYDFYADEKNIGVEWRGINGKNDEIEENFEETGEVPLSILMHYGYDYENANCGYDRENNSAIMYVGDGRAGGTLYNQGRAVDVIAHEYQHAITELATPGSFGLLYLNESGAINEAISDIFGNLVEGHDPSEEEFWSVGENAGPNDGVALRSIKQPFGYSPMHMDDELPLCSLNHNHYSEGRDNCDNGNAHGNCSILPHAQYRMWLKMPDYFTRERIGTLWFATVGMITYECTFEQFAQQMIQASKNLGFEEEAQDVIYECLFESGIIKEEGIKTHTVTFRQDGKTLEKITVRDGQSAYFPVLPDRKITSGNYVFEGWDKDLTNVTQDLVTEPVFRTELTKFTVRFMNGGTEIASIEVEYGKDATPPSVVPEKESSARCDYEFDGWDGSLQNVTSDLTVNALFREVPHVYEVVFMSEGKEFSRMKVEYGNSATPPEETPEKESDLQNTYTFKEWEGQLENITEDTVLTAVFASKPRNYSVKFFSEGKQISEGLWQYGATVPLEEPKEEGKTFDGWYYDGELTRRVENLVVEGDVTVFAKWKENANVGLIVGVSVGGAALLGTGIFLFVKKKRV